MPRIARLVHEGVPYHVTHRGNRGQPVFLDDHDRESYLRRLAWLTRAHEVRIGAWCLMTNHVHLVLTPATSNGLAVVMRTVQGQHAQSMNDRHGFRGHLWDGRFHSVAMDEDHEVAAMLYIERNPVKAGMVGRAEDHPWSSAQAHVAGVDDRDLLDLASWRARFTPRSWRMMLGMSSDEALEDRMRAPRRRDGVDGEHDVRFAMDEIARQRERLRGQSG